MDEATFRSIYHRWQYSRRSGAPYHLIAADALAYLKAEQEFRDRQPVTGANLIADLLREKAVDDAALDGRGIEQ